MPRSTLNSLLSSELVSPRYRSFILRRLGADVMGTRIMSDVRFIGQLKNLTIGSGTFLNTGSIVFLGSRVHIGKDVAIGPRCTIMTGTHAIGDSSRRASHPTQYRDVRIEDGAWLGAGVIVQPGVTIGHGCVVAAGAVVTGDCDANVLYGGIPARPLRKLGD